MISNLPNLQQEVTSNVQNTSVPALESNIQSVRVEEHTLDLGTATTVDNNSLVFSSLPHNTIHNERADSQIKITQKSTRLHVLQVITNLNSVYHSYHHGEVTHPDSFKNSWITFNCITWVIALCTHHVSTRRSGKEKSSFLSSKLFIHRTLLLSI